MATCGLKRVLNLGCAVAALAALIPVAAHAENGKPTTAIVSISAPVNGAPLTISADVKKFAGAISSLTYRGVEYINVGDHGRQLQSASTFDDLGECFNPTEAGSRDDGNKPASTSKLLGVRASGNMLRTRVAMAFWLAPGTDYQAMCSPASKASSAQNSTLVSNHILEKTVTIGQPGNPHAIGYHIAFTIGENHRSANFEASTAYLPPRFSMVLSYNPSSGALQPLDASYTGGITNQPVIIATPDGRNALGVFGQKAGPLGSTKAFYAYYEFPDVSKWSCVFQATNLKAGSKYSFDCPIAVGTVDEVVAAINKAEPMPGRLVPQYAFRRGQFRLVTTSFSEGMTKGFDFAGTAYVLYPDAQGGGKAPLYRCYWPNPVYAYASRDAHCEGAFRKGVTAVRQGVYGYVAAKPGKGLVPLYRFLDRQSWVVLPFVTTNKAEGMKRGLKESRILGYVPGIR